MDVAKDSHKHFDMLGKQVYAIKEGDRTEGMAIVYGTVAAIVGAGDKGVGNLVIVYGEQIGISVPPEKVTANRATAFQLYKQSLEVYAGLCRESADPDKE